MIQRCPKCHHVRAPDATTPDWQCPSCGVAYAKASGQGAYVPPLRAHPVGSSANDGSSFLSSWLFKLVIVVAAVFAWSTRSQWLETPQRVSQEVAAPTGISIYTTSTCGYCHDAKAYMDQRRIAYTEYDVEHDIDRRRQFYALGGQGTPLIVVKGEILHGFEAGQLQDAIDRSGRH